MFVTRWICLHRLTSLPEKPATIDWSYYRSAIAKAGMVDEFEKKVRKLISSNSSVILENYSDFLIITNSNSN